MAKKMNTYKKYVFTSTAPDGPLEWNNAETVTVGSDEDIVRFVNDLKSQPGDLLVTGLFDDFVKGRGGLGASAL